MAAKVSLNVTIADESAASFIARLRPAVSTLAFVQQMVTLFTSFLAGARRGRVRIRVDDSVGVAAAKTVACVQASQTSGDRLLICLPGMQPIALTGTASAVVAGDGQYRNITSNTAVATSLKNAINTHPTLQNYIVATSSVGDLILTARNAGSIGNSIQIVKKVTTSAAFSGTGLMTGGVDAGALNTAGLTFTIAAALTANDTLTIGTVVLTGKASPSGESQFACGVSVAADTAALVACINAHSKLKGLFTCTGNTSTGVITILCWMEGRSLYQTVLAKSAAQGTLSATTFVPAATDTWAASTIEYGLGAP